MNIFCKYGDSIFTVPNIRSDDKLTKVVEQLDGLYSEYHGKTLKFSKIIDQKNNEQIDLHEEIGDRKSLKFVSNESQNDEQEEDEAENNVVYLDGSSLTTKLVQKLGSGKYKIKISDKVKERIKNSRNIVSKIISEDQVKYGINTGFGKFSSTVIKKNNLIVLQENLIRSHAAGVGPSLDSDTIRRIMALRINVLSKGFSGVSEQCVESMINAFNKSCLPRIPMKGTVGASGDLAPLAHLTLGLMGEGEMWSEETGVKNATEVLNFHKLTPLVLGPKEGLSMVNGTQFIVAIGVEVLERATNLVSMANIATALTIEGLRGSIIPFLPEIHEQRPHVGQMKVAKHIFSLLTEDGTLSDISMSHKNCGKVQDAYSIRCTPQVHGIVFDTLNFVRNIMNIEVNAAQDNPMVFPNGNILSCGNFHGEYSAKALDYLAIAVHELGNISERRQERLINPAYSELPAFLTEDGGLNSGFMIAQCTSAALVSENKTLCHPSSVDSITTSAGTEDHVSMGGWSARKSLKVLEHVETILAIEILMNCQAIEFHRPLRTTKCLECLIGFLRDHIKPWYMDRYMAPDIEKVTKMIKENKFVELSQQFLRLD
ncbi:hypothetical protein SNEBB_002080 [Seison nebaliae]|nr:hypothetical protein SNEBB_002080 [Seison nebaliae]